jgi:hypothetical protein
LAQEAIGINKLDWELDDKGVSIEVLDGRKAIKITSGKAILSDLTLEDGIIEFDIYLSGERAFAYLYFRDEQNGEHEEIYLRSHKSNAPDALQYSPVFQGRSAWQIYHGDLGTANADLPAKTWIKVKMELIGEKMRLWIGDVEQPNMVIEKLGRSSTAGGIALRGFIPRNSPAKYSAYFSNIKITKIKADRSKVEMTKALPPGQITKWRVSPAFSASKGPIFTLPDLPSSSEWSIPSMQENGFFEFLRSREIPKESRNWAVAAELELISEKAQTCELHLGFSDEITLQVNGQRRLYQDASYRYANKRQEGLMHSSQIIVYIELNRGSNILQAIVADRFGGWGLTARLHNCPGIKQR